jgi:hypothetical protein
LRNGSWTLNRYRAEIGEPPIDGGDDAVLIDRQNLVLWSDFAAMSKATVAAKQGKGNTPALPPGQTPPAIVAATPDNGVQPAPDQPAPSTAGEPPDANTPPADQAGKGKKAKTRTESISEAQVACYQSRLRLALATFAETAADDVYAQLAHNFPPKAIAWGA